MMLRLKAGTACFAGLLIASLGSSCTVGPDYKSSQTKVKDNFGELGKPTTNPSSQPSVISQRDIPLSEWWTTFHDPELDTLIGRAATGGFDVQLAASRLRQARYQLNIAGASIYPSVNMDGGYDHARGSKNIRIPAGAFGGAPKTGSTSAAQNRRAPQAVTAGGNNATSGGGIAGPQSPLGQGGLPGVVTDVYQVGFDASWEIDVFGGTRRAVEAAVADTDAAIEDRRSILVSLLAEVARNYIELRGYQRQAAIARDNLAIQQDTLSLVRSQFESGFKTQLDLSRQLAEVASTKAIIPPLEAHARVAIHALGILMGQDPDAVSEELSDERAIPPVPPEVPVGVPSQLLRRRPDIRRAERQLAAASARVGVATADLFPKFDIAALVGIDSTKPKNLLNWSSRYYSFTPGINWSIFDAGRVRANINVQNEAEQQARVTYQQTVLGAVRDVEDALVMYQTEQTRRASLTDAVSASRDAVDLARQQYQHGTIDFLVVLDTQRSLLMAQDELVQSDRAVSSDLVALYKALGGGWEIENSAQAQ